MAVLNSFGLNMSLWGMPLVIGWFPTVYCCSLSLKIQPGFCPPCSLSSLSPQIGYEDVVGSHVESFSKVRHLLYRESGLQELSLTKKRKRNRALN